GLRRLRRLRCLAPEPRPSTAPARILRRGLHPRHRAPPRDNPTRHPPRVRRRMTMPDLTPDQRTLVEHLWNHLMEHGTWPRRRQVELWLDDAGKDFKFQAWAGQVVRMESESDPLVRPTFDTLLELKPARTFLEPLPQLARLAA